MVTINDNGTPDDISDDTLTYTPNDGFEGEDVFEYTVCDALGNCDTAIITVTVGNSPTLEAVDDMAVTEQDMPIGIDILLNDVGVPQVGTLTVTEPTNGTVMIDDNGTPDDLSDDFLMYTPDTGFIGEDSFEYTLCDDQGNCDTAVVVVTVGQLPMIDAIDDVATTESDENVIILFWKMTLTYRKTAALVCHNLPEEQWRLTIMGPRTMLPMIS